MLLAGSAVAAVFLASLLAPGPVFALRDANEASCPNEALAGFQPYLPDCRAYEMVSPPFKGGAQVSVHAVSADGSHIVISARGAFAGTENIPNNKEQGAVYEFARSGAGWVASPLTPPASLSPDANLLGVSADATRTLWEVLGSSKSIYASDLDVREADGSFVKVGPVVPPAGATGPPAGAEGTLDALAEFAGASKDLSHTLFTTYAANPTFLWPGDTTQPGSQDRSLYEYVGTGNTHPMLVGVCTSSIGGSCPNGEGHLISDCGTDLGSRGVEGGGDAYNSVSASGETVFFTAFGQGAGCNPGIGDHAPEVSELYARLDQFQTVAISEPSHSQCNECNTPATIALGRRSAIFQGASEDGSKVFFLTEQELFSGDSTMNLYEYDFNNLTGEKIVRVSGGSSTPEVEGVARVSEDGSHVYFVARGALAGANAEGHLPVSGANNLYLFERDAAYPGGRTAFIATLSSETEAELKTDEESCAALSGEEKEECEARVKREFEARNEADASDWFPRDERPVQATPDGRILVFTSVMDLTPGDTSILPQVFEYDAQKEKLVRVSIGPTGLAIANASPSHIPSQSYGESAPTTSATDSVVSADGSRVLFSSPGALTEGAEAAAAAEAKSVYEYRSTGSIENGSVYLISDGTNALSAEIAGLDASGDDAFFQTTDPLLPTDVDTQFDIYDARVDGGFPAPVAPPAACEGEPCQGALSVPPSFGAPGSASVSGAGNLTPTPTPVPTPVTPKPKPKPVKCKKGFVKKHGRCVRVKTPKKKTKAKKADKGRGVK